MRKLLVSIDVVSREATLAELTRRIGVEPDASSSHEKGTRRGRGVWEMTIWRIRSSREGDLTASLSDHIRSIASLLPISRLARGGVLPRDAVAILNIGVICSPDLVLYESLEILPDDLKTIGRGRLGIEVTFYPPQLPATRRRSRRKRPASES